MGLRFSGKTILVTGASRGLGRDVAIAFAAEGAHVFVGYRGDAAKADETARRARAAGGAATPIRLDVRDRAHVVRVVDEILVASGRIDVLVNNAAIASDAPFILMEHEAFDDVVATNLAGVFTCCRAVIQPMIAAGRGAIVNVASIAGLHASPGQANYAASKGGVLALTQTLAAECGPRGVRVNAVVPGLLTIGMASRMDPRLVEERTARIPARRPGTGAEVAAAVLFLASEEASYVYGQSLVVDGGLTL